MKSPNNLKKVFTSYELKVERPAEGLLNKSYGEKLEIFNDFFDEYYKNDIRLLELEEPFEFGDETG